MYPHHVETVLGAGFASRSHRVHSDSKVSMTRDQQLEMIRQKCFEANPDKGARLRWVMC
jgi:hypothetical protein